MPVVYVPTIYNETGDIASLIRLWNEANKPFDEITFDFRNCSFLSHCGVAFLGGLARYIEEENFGNAVFAWETLQSRVRINLEKNGFLSAFDAPGFVRFAGNAIPFRRDKAEDRSPIMAYLKDQWLGRGWIQISEAVRNAIAGKMWEIYTNGFEHANSTIGLFSCGQHYPNKKLLSLATVDFGIGIPTLVRSKISQFTGLSDAECLKWAFGKGNSTAYHNQEAPSIGRGLGLDFLKSFVKVNGGKLELFSAKGYVRIDNKQDYYANWKNHCPGTMINITIQCDERYYKLESEVISTGPFF